MNLNVEDKIHLNEFKLRDYQLPIWDAIFNRGVKRMVIVLPRRAGKDLTLFNAAVRWALMKPCMVLYVFTNAKLARKALWDGIDIDGKKILDYIPARLVAKRNETEMKIIFVNGSVLQFMGAENHQESLRGTNPSAIILSEYAYYKHPEIIDTVSPILAGNGGWLALASTPQGKNSFYTVYKLAQELPDWWTYVKTVDDTQHIPPDLLEFEKKRMSPDMFLQEYYCSFDRGISGAIFGKALQDLRLEGHITTVAWQPGLLVHVAIDIGLSKGNATTIIWFQVIGDAQIINVIDCYSSENLGLDFYAGLLQTKPYKYGIYLAPHDLAVREWGGGAVTRYEKARELGINFTICPQTLLVDQIENTLTHFPKIWIDEVKCKPLLDALENYFREWDEQRQVYKPKPVHNWASNYASAFMLMCLGLHKTASGRTGEEYDKLRNEMLYGGQANLPRIFRKGFGETY